ncbi:retroviral-like aspartic protease 1 [Plakobranchus ocellatus]|uniref:Retroviral-like aspartic protease 1 n=1 Tax=Plakobranchus ocellatus TaxID=259542 RepID=A0AAV3ZB71_9GAST|nr:retroviral-like aspartic protease 1 [Plakobranchus ocellatus]
MSQTPASFKRQASQSYFACLSSNTYCWLDLVLCVVAVRYLKELIHGEKREEYLKQEFKLLAERQEKKEEVERQGRKEEADRKERLELEKMKLDAEMKLLQAKIEAGIIKNEPDGSGARSNDAGAKHPKLPNFQDGRDDLDIWLTRFERFAEINGWSREKWSSSLCALLTGRALDCYGRLSAEQAKDYDNVKEALMKRYDLTEDGYRRKFRTCKPAEGESSDLFIVRIVMYLDRWIELSKTDKSNAAAELTNLRIRSLQTSVSFLIKIQTIFLYENKNIE